jgi:hypothetical protein
MGRTDKQLGLVDQATGGCGNPFRPIVADADNVNLIVVSQVPSPEKSEKVSPILSHEGELQQ